MDALNAWNEDYVTNIVVPAEESVTLERKATGKFALTAKGQPDGATKEELAKQVAAFSNSGDGFLVYGIDDNKTLDAGVPMLIGTQSTKDWVEAIMPKLVYPSVSGCEAKMIQVAGHHASGLGVLVIGVPLSERRPHWVVGPNELAYIRAGAHSIPMRPQTFIDIASRENAAASEIEGINPIGTPAFAGSVKTYTIWPLVRLLNGPVSDRWAFEMKVRSGRIKIKYPSNAGAKITSEVHLYLLGNEPLFPGRSTPVSPNPFYVDWDGAVGNNEIEAILYVGSAPPVRQIFAVNDVDPFHAKVTSGLHTIGKS